MAGDERYDLWRKQGFICKPYTGEISDGARFISDYMEQAQKYLQTTTGWRMTSYSARTRAVMIPPLQLCQAQELQAMP